MPTAVRRLFLACALAGLSACAGPAGPADIELRTGAGSAAASSGGRAASGEAASACGPSVTVRPGDTLYAISRRCGVHVDTLAAANGLSAPFALHPGDTLRTRGSAVSAQAPAPPPRSAAASRSSGGSTYVVRQGDTLYSVARAYGVQPEILARLNGLGAPYTIYPGQPLVTPGPQVAAVERRDPEPALAGGSQPRLSTPAASSADIRFAWPLDGEVLERFGAAANGRRNDGVKIAARAGEPVRAAAAGEVVYAGDEIQGYGELVLIRHSERWVTAYAHNARLRVREGDRVEQGDIIAEAGETGSARRPQLHFEIRRNVTPVDPLRHLPAR